MMGDQDGSSRLDNFKGVSKYMRIVILFFMMGLSVSGAAFGHGMSEEDQIRAAEGGFLDFFPLGAIHMLTGYDHLLFLFGVVFFLTGFKDIVKFITAFTVGHSITLIFATFLAIQANYFLVDAVIALTVCYKGFDNLDGFKRYLDMKSPNLVGMVFIFGLIHGFGLSTRLQAVTIGESWPLLGKIIAFNIGVEAGQIAALVVILLALSTWRRTDSFARFSNAANTGLVVIGGMLFMMQVHGYQHNSDPSAYGFDEDGHSHAHENTTVPVQDLPPGWHLDPGETVPHTHDEKAELPPGWHIDPGETVPHTHDDNAEHSHDEAEHTHDEEAEHSHDEEAHEHPHDDEAEHSHDEETHEHPHDDEEAHEHPHDDEDLNLASVAKPTFNKEIIRIFQNRCQSCHHSGAPFTPMSLSNFGVIRPWAKAIQKRVVSGDMPPWQADSAAGEFANDISITQQEIDTISRWVDARAPQGNRADLPPLKDFKREWFIETPDVVLDTGVDFDVPANGTLPVQTFRIKTDFGEDKWVSAVEAQPGNREAVQQIDVFVEYPGDDPTDPDGDIEGAALLGTYAQGYTASVYAKGTGKLIKPGATLVLRILYTTTGTPATDRSRIGLKFHNGPVEKQVITRAIAKTEFEIPPHIESYPLTAAYTFTEAVTIYSLRPLMHYRGESFKYIARYPDGTENMLLNVNRYNYFWQTYYFPKNPIRLPAGTVLECVAIMNNSHENARNPEPHATVRSGDQLLDEKMIGWIDYTRDDEDLTLH